MINISAAFKRALVVATFAASHYGHAEEFEFVEPITTEETLPNELGEWDFRLSSEFHKAGDESIALLPKAQLFFGLSETMGVDLGVSMVRRDGDEEGYEIGPLSAGLKWLAHASPQSGAAVVLGLEVEFPTGDSPEEAGERAYEITPFIAFLKQMGDVTLQGNLGYSIEYPEEEDRVQSIPANLSAAYPINGEKVHLLAEINAEFGLDGASDSVAFAPGLKFGLSEESFLGIAIPIGLTSETADWGVILQWQLGF